MFGLLQKLYYFEHDDQKSLRGIIDLDLVQGKSSLLLLIKYLSSSSSFVHISPFPLIILLSLLSLEVKQCDVDKVPHPTLKHAFHLVTPLRTYVLCAPTQDELEGWISSIVLLLSENYYSPDDVIQ